ncbi:Uncharacterised protein [Mycolicibacterium aurum]|uniref:Uncharacterized protein n=1 Tax=Mycolicibacterium aurum TaxID=1791 RepID=A0A448IZE5_MYCAU|nr:hypothetical protein [Mycolicibacterium aurum]VEG57812.1 Uncharacterised protein [Mycolicibacterium aurum]
MTNDKPNTTQTDTAPEAADDDVVSDPSKGADGEGSDWADEGGATPTGPATE